MKWIKFEHLYAIGCSMTKHGPLEYDECWPHFLAENMGVTHTNDGEGCGSNHRTFRKVNEFLNSYKGDLEKLLVVIQLTHPFRFELRDPTLSENDERHFVSFNDQDHAVNYRQTKSNRLWRKDVSKYIEMKAKVYGDKDIFDDFIMQAQAIANELNSRKIHHVFLHYWNPLDSQFKLERFPGVNFLGGRQETSAIFALLPQPHSDYSCSPTDGHPNAQGNKFIGDAIYNTLFGDENDHSI